MAHDVFISHSAKDKTTADAVCAMLESNGVRCWIAPRDVTPGMEWGQCIIEAIEECRVMVLVFTAHANESSQIRREIERAVNHGVAILPVRIEDVLPGKALEFFIGNVHWLDALTPPLESHLKNLAGTVKMLIGRMEPRGAAAEIAESVAPSVARSDSPESTSKWPRVSALGSTQAAGEQRIPTAESSAANVVAPASQFSAAPSPIFSGISPAKTEKPKARRRLRIIVVSASALIVLLLALSFLIPRSNHLGVRSSGRLELALVAANSAHESGQPLHEYWDASKTISIERDLTVPGDIEYVEMVTDGAGRPAFGIRLTAAAVKRMNSGDTLIGRQIALVLDGRTVLAAPVVQAGLGDRIVMTGNLSTDDIHRLLDAIATSSPQPDPTH